MEQRSNGIHEKESGLRAPIIRGIQRFDLRRRSFPRPLFRRLDVSTAVLEVSSRGGRNADWAHGPWHLFSIPAVQRGLPGRCDYRFTFQNNAVRFSGTVGELKTDL